MVSVLMARALAATESRVRPQRGQLFDRLRVFECPRLRDGQSELESELLYGGNLRLESTPGRAVGLREDERDLVPGCVHGTKRGGRELGRSGKKKFH